MQCSTRTQIKLCPKLKYAKDANYGSQEHKQLKYRLGSYNLKMKKIPSYPKITAKTNITVTQTQNININSPKAIGLKKGFKPDTKKTKHHPQIVRNESSTSYTKPDTRPNLATRKSSNKIDKQAEYQRSIKNSKSQKELAVLSEKLKRLEDKIREIKAKQKKEKNSSFSNRSMSRNRQTSNYAKNDNTSSRKDIKLSNKLPRNQSAKILKKSYSDKLGIRLPQTSKVIKNLGNSQIKQQKNRKGLRESADGKNQRQALQQFLTQVPKRQKNDAHLKEGVEESLKNRTYELSESENDDSEEDQAYYIGKAEKSLTKPSLFAIREHIFQSLQTMQFLLNIRKPSVQEISKKAMALKPSKFAHTIILDLDETLIHCNESLNIPHDVKLTIKFPTGEKIDAGVNIRPYAVEFLEQLSQIAEVVVFTASHECYANVVLDYLDPHKKLISDRLFREHCWQTDEGIYIKDLRVLKNRSMENMVLVDNAAYSYYFQLDNGIPIIPYYNEKKDKQLCSLLAYLREVVAISEGENISLRGVNSKYFKFDKYCKYEDVAVLVQQLYPRRELELDNNK